MLCSDAIKRYLEWKATHAPRAANNYRIWLERFIQWSKDRELEEYTIYDVVSYQNKLSDRFASASLRFATTALKNFLKFYQEQGHKVVAQSLVKIPRAGAQSHRAITEKEYKRLLYIMPKNEFIPLRDRVIIRMLWDTGMRVSELCALQCSMIDGRKMVIPTKKRNTMRIVMWGEETDYELHRYLRIRNEMMDRNSLFVGHSKGTGWNLTLSARSVERIVRGWAKEAGLTGKITPHSFRHGWAHKRRDMGAPLSFIQKGLGHASPITTFVYEQYCDKDFAQTAKKYL